MKWTVETIIELLQEKPILRKIIDEIESFPKDRQAEIIGNVVKCLEARKSKRNNRVGKYTT